MRDIAEAARLWLGTPFRWEASLRGVGCDCRGLVAGVARDCGRLEAASVEAGVVGYSRRIDEAALLAGLDRLFARRPDGEAPEPGDVLALALRYKVSGRILFKVQHLALAAPDPARMIHAYARDPAQVVEVPIATFQHGQVAGVWRWRDVG